MSEIQEKVLEAIQKSGVKNGIEYSAYQVAEWYNKIWNEEKSVKSIAFVLMKCPLPRRRLDSAEQWKWESQYGHRTEIVFYNRETGPRAYIDGNGRKQKRYRHEREYQKRMDDTVENRLNKLRELKYSGQFYDHDEYLALGGVEE